MKPRHRHKWVTLLSFGYWGHFAQCRLCKKFATFVIVDEDA